MSEYKMTGAELASQLKETLNSNVKFNDVGGVNDESLHLTEEDIKWWRDDNFVRHPCLSADPKLIN